MQYGNDAEFFKEGTWNAEIPEVIKPVESDIILRGRNNYSAFQGTDLQSILRWEKIKKLYIAGFLTNVCILETVREAHDLGLIEEGLKVFVVKDCCAAETIEEHDYAINYSLPLLCETIASRQVLKSMNIDSKESIKKGVDKSILKEGNASKPKSKSPPLRRGYHLLGFAWHRSDFRWRSYFRYVILTLLVQFIFGQDYIFKDG